MSKAILWDMDGVIVNSEPCFRKADKAFFLKTIGKAVDIGDFPDLRKNMFGRRPVEGMKLLEKHFNLTEDPKTLIAFRESLIVEELKNVQFIEGFQEFYEKMKSQDVKMIVATSSDRALIGAIDNALGIRKMFPAIVGGEDVGVGKPSPDIYLLAAQKLSVDPQQCLVFEDALHGITAGKAAGATVIGITTAFSREELLAAGADHVIDSFSEVKNDWWA